MGLIARSSAWLWGCWGGQLGVSHIPAAPGPALGQLAAPPAALLTPPGSVGGEVPGGAASFQHLAGGQGHHRYQWLFVLKGLGFLPIFCVAAGLRGCEAAPLVGHSGKNGCFRFPVFTLSLCLEFAEI